MATPNSILQTSPISAAREWKFTLTSFISVLAIVVSLTASLTVASCGGFTSTAAADLNQRVTVVETKQTEADKRLERIENKLDRVIENTSK